MYLRTLMRDPIAAQQLAGAQAVVEGGEVEKREDKQEPDAGG
jgi:hypothetical protein